MKTADEYRKNADVCREKANQEHDYEGKKRWLRLAEIWVKLGESAERKRQIASAGFAL